MDSIIHKIEASFKKANIPTFKAGDKLKLHLKVKEGTSERVQIFEGDVIARQGAGISENIIIRKISNGVGVEKTLCLHSPNIEKIEVVKIGKVRRAKLYYIRHRVGKTAKIVEKKTSQNKIESIAT